MARSSKSARSRTEVETASGPSLAQLIEQTQIDFELDFYGKLLEKNPYSYEVLRAHASNLAQKKLYHESLLIERRIIELRPKDALAHYNLACNLALLKQADQALDTLRQALELGYRDFPYIHRDRDLDSVRKDPRFRKLIREFENRS